MIKRHTSDLIREFSTAFKRPVNDHVVELTVSERELLGKLLFEEVVEYCTKGLGLNIMLGKTPIHAGGLTLELNEGQRYDPVESADGLADVNVVIHFNANWHGFDLDKVTEIVHESNMSKLGENGEPIINECINRASTHNCPSESCVLRDKGKPLGKILKGPNYWEPTQKIAELIMRNGWVTKDRPTGVLICGAEDVDSRAAVDRCPDHPDATATPGFGLAGGGFGPYLICNVCRRVFGKIDFPEDE